MMFIYSVFRQRSHDLAQHMYYKEMSSEQNRQMILLVRISLCFNGLIWLMGYFMVFLLCKKNQTFGFAYYYFIGIRNILTADQLAQ